MPDGFDILRFFRAGDFYHWWFLLRGEFSLPIYHRKYQNPLGLPAFLPQAKDIYFYIYILIYYLAISITDIYTSSYLITKLVLLLRNTKSKNTINQKE